MMNVLIVDDDPISLEILRSALEESRYEVELAYNGEEALQRVSQGGIRMVISDWEMPHMNGLELCQAVRRQSTDGYVYFILLTGKGTSKEIVEGLSSGADDFIVKPFNHAELTARLRSGERILSLESREMVIFALAKLAESRDTETGSHLERVQRYSKRLAESLRQDAEMESRIDPEFIRLVYQTSPLHDIGKVGIPDSVLLKPGRLSDDEYEIMKSHAVIGAETLDAAMRNYPNARFLRVARDIAASHHERWDGRGYPSGLIGEEIPLAARIVAVADVYDALTSRRVYKDAYTHKIARDIIVGDSGTHFDPACVAAFVRVEEDFIRIQQQFSEPEAQSVAKFFAAAQD